MLTTPLRRKINVKNYPLDEMLPLETKQSGGKLLPPLGDGRIILRWIFRKLEGVVGTGWSWLRIGTDGGHLWLR